MQEQVPISELCDKQEHVTLKNAWGTLTGVWVPHDMRDQIVDFVRSWSEKTEIAGRFRVYF